MIHIKSATSSEHQPATTQPFGVRIGGSIHRRWTAAKAAIDRIAIRGQLGPSVGYPSDRRPEPPF